MYGSGQVSVRRIHLHAVPPQLRRMLGSAERPGLLLSHRVWIYVFMLEDIARYDAVAYNSHSRTFLQCLACHVAVLPFLNGTECIATCPALQQQGVCLSACTPGFFRQGSQCIECDATCRTCTAGGHQDCTACPPGRFLLNGECRTCAGCSRCGALTPSQTPIKCERHQKSKRMRALGC